MDLPFAYLRKLSNFSKQCLINFPAFLSADMSYSFQCFRAERIEAATHRSLMCNLLCKLNKPTFYLITGAPNTEVMGFSANIYLYTLFLMHSHAVKKLQCSSLRLNSTTESSCV